jgi:hypothetical protein
MNSYLIIGGGRVSLHMQTYFKLKGLKYAVWTRKKNTPEELKQLIKSNSRTLLLIRDDQMDTFLEKYPELNNTNTVHFSGARSVGNLAAAHPLMTFGTVQYDLKTYEEIPFVTEIGKKTFSEIFPELKNSAFAIHSHQKALYHALCVLVGNFTTLLWEHIGKTIEKDLALPQKILQPYLKQVSKNTLDGMANNYSALTGPVSRGDISTIIRNIDALSDLPERDLYFEFLKMAQLNGKKIGDLPNEYLAI